LRVVIIPNLRYIFNSPQLAESGIIANVIKSWLFEVNMRITQRKGDLATAKAIATFTQMGYDVLIPITESAPYDIVIDTSEGLKRVQVKYSSDRKVDLRNIHSNSNGYVVKKS
jgi:hypothetical protein